MKWKKYRFVADANETDFDWSINIPIYAAYALIGIIMLFGSFFTVP